MNVFVITFCQDEKDLWGNLLVFDTIRTGFPTAKIAVVDNGSIEPCRVAVKEAAQRVGAEFFRLTDHSHPHLHSDILNRITRLSGDETWVLVDPDMIFYEKVEDWEFRHDSVLAGAWVPGYNDEIVECYTYPRLHTSLLWTLRPGKLREVIWEIQKKQWDWDPWRAGCILQDGKWVRYDTGSQVCMTVPIQVFSLEQMDAYTHVMCGTQASFVYERLGDKTRERLMEVHRKAREAPEMLKGIWREQLAYFEDRR